MTFARRIDEALEKIDLALYRSASVLLNEAFQECDSPEVWEKNWSLLFGLIHTLLLSGQSAAMNALLLKLQARGDTKELDVRISSQLAAFYFFLDSGADREVLEVTLRELQVLDRQHGGRYRAGVLAAEGVLFSQHGDSEHALESLQRAWAHSRTLGGFCPQQAICEILRLGLSSHDSEVCQAWRTALFEVPSRSLCCRIRLAIARAEMAAVMDEGWTVDESYELLAVLRNVECPDLVVRGCGAIIRAAYVQRSLSPKSRQEVGAESLLLAKNVTPSQRYVFERALAGIDLGLCAVLKRKGLAVTFDYSPIGIMLHLKTENREPLHDPEVELACDIDLDRDLEEAREFATKLDQRLGNPGFTTLVSNRKICLQAP